MQHHRTGTTGAVHSRYVLAKVPATKGQLLAPTVTVGEVPKLTPYNGNRVKNRIVDTYQNSMRFPFGGLCQVSTTTTNELQELIL
jgi:hypothetical protein